MINGARTGRWAVTASAVLAAAVLAAAAPAVAKPSIKSVTIEGNAVVGETLTAKVDPPGDPTELAFAWLRCQDEDGTCSAIVGADAATYAVADVDVGYRLVVVVKAGKEVKASPPTAIVTRPPPPPPPPPAPTPSPAPSPSSDQPTPAPAPTPRRSTAPPAQLAPTYLRPFPVVRMRGHLARGGAVITLLRVRAPKRTHVHVRCTGSGCPLRRAYASVGRLRPFERFLPAGVRIAIRAWTPGRIGKYVRIVIRDGKVPARRDACVLPRSTKAVRCPEP